MTTLNIEINDRAVISMLNSLLSKVGDAQPLMDDIGAAVTELVRNCFEEGREPGGAAWEPLSPASRQGQPLRDTDRLMNSITYLAVGNITHVGTNVVYALQHQFGFTVEAQNPTGGSARFGYIPKNSPYLRWQANGEWHYAKRVLIPARPFFPTEELPDDWRKEITELIGEYLLPEGAA